MPERSSPAEIFDSIVDRYYDAWFRFHPEAAVEAGRVEHAGALKPFSDDAIGALVRLNQELLNTLGEADLASLDADRRIDALVASGGAMLESDRLVEADWRHRDPQEFLPLGAIYQLTIHEVPDRAAALRDRLAATASHLDAACAQVAWRPEAIPPLWLESALSAIDSGGPWLRGLGGHPVVAAAFSGAEAELESLLGTAADALERFGGFLDSEIAPRASGDFACGRTHFDRMLSQRHFLDVDADVLHGLGERLFRQTERDLKRCCLEIAGHEDVDALNRRIQADHLPPDGVIDAYRDAMDAARSFVRDRELVTLPEPERLSVIATPEFLRHEIPFAAYHAPTPDDPDQHGWYYVTPPAGEEQAREHTRIGVDNTSVHEAYPGHHLQFVAAHRSPAASTFPRLLNASATLFEGWALYCEQLMHEEGFLDRPEHRFMLLKDRLWRALRIMIDVEIHTRGVGVEQAAQRMVRHLGFSQEQARAELTWYSRAPSTPMGYATGWALINAARDRLRADQPALGLRDFHDRLIASGSIGLPLVLSRQFGEALAARAARMVFGGD